MHKSTETTQPPKAPEVNNRTGERGPATTADVAALDPGAQIEAELTCTDKRRLLTRRGEPFLVLWLSDDHGALKGTVFERTDELAERFGEGDRVRVRAVVNEYRGQSELKIDWIERARPEGTPEAPLNGDPPKRLPAIPEALIPGASHRAVPPIGGDSDELEGYLEALVSEVADRPLRALLEALLANPILRTDLRRVPCDPGSHHNYPGGLLEHTVAVARLAQETAQLHPRLDSDLLLAAAIVHDLGRTDELEPEPPFAPTADGGPLGHLWLCAELIAEHARDLPDTHRVAELQHCVLHHRGPLPGVPASRLLPEAVVLGKLCELDARAQSAPPPETA